jgi:TonB family protein
MSTTVTELTQGSLVIGARRSSTAQNPEAWKKLMGQKPVSARLATLPEAKVSRSALLSSTLFQVAVAVFLVSLPMFFPEKLVTQIVYEVTPIAAPDTSVPLPEKPPPPVVRPKVQQEPPPPPVEEQPQPVRPRALIAPRNLTAPKPKVVDVRSQDAPKLDQPILEAKFEAPVDQPVRPREPVKTGNLTTGSAAPATLKNMPLDKVQTGGFGDPNGLPGPSDPNKRANINHQGSPLLPPGPGYGNGTGGANGARGTVASSGFGNGVAIPPAGNPAPRGQVKSGGFAAATSTADVPKAKQADGVPSVESVVIVFKPKPVYSDEARKLNIEGDVLVSVVFQASGTVQVIGVTKGLGHGLDEAAVRAAQQIRFKPALQNGNAVDFSATVHIEFQLAF